MHVLKSKSRHTTKIYGCLKNLRVTLTCHTLKTAEVMLAEMKLHCLLYRNEKDDRRSKRDGTNREVAVVYALRRYV